MKKTKKASGGKYNKARKKKLHEKQGQARIVKLSKKKIKLIKTRGGNKKIVSLSHDSANLTENGKSKKVSIKNVLETPSNRFLARQNILVKGSLIETELGKARITNRPSQEGIVQCELLAQD